MLSGEHSVHLKQVTPRCYNTDTGVDLSWDMWLPSDGEPMFSSHDPHLDDVRYGRERPSELYAGPEQTGRCLLPRKHHCVDDGQCRPGTLCVPWRTFGQFR